MGRDPGRAGCVGVTAWPTRRLFEAVGPATWLPQGDIGNVGVNGVVHGSNERGKVDVEAVVVGDEPAAVHSAMGPEGVEGHP